MTADKRTFITMIALLLYVGLFNLYIYMMVSGYNEHYTALLSRYIRLGMICFYLTDRYYYAGSFFHYHFNRLCIAVVIVNEVLYILNFHGFIQPAHKNFLLFNSCIFVTTVLILISAFRNDYFKRRYDKQLKKNQHLKHIVDKYESMLK